MRKCGAQIEPVVLLLEAYEKFAAERLARLLGEKADACHETVAHAQRAHEQVHRLRHLVFEARKAFAARAQHVEQRQRWRDERQPERGEEVPDLQKKQTERAEPAEERDAQNRTHGAVDIGLMQNTAQAFGVVGSREPPVEPRAFGENYGAREGGRGIVRHRSRHIRRDVEAAQQLLRIDGRFADDARRGEQRRERHGYGEQDRNDFGTHRGSILIASPSPPNPRNVRKFHQAAEFPPRASGRESAGGCRSVRMRRPRGRRVQYPCARS